MYFAYGSNLAQARFLARIQKFHAATPATLKNYRFAYNKRGLDGTAKGNLVAAEGSAVQGICYEIEAAALAILDGYEKGYARMNVELILVSGLHVQAVTYLSQAIANDLKPSAEYRAIVVQGAEEWGLDAEYVRDNLETV